MFKVHGSRLMERSMDITKIDKNLLNDLFQKALQSERHRYAYDLRNTEEDSLQRMLNAILPDSEVPIHRHEDTSETIVCLHGRLEVVFYEKTKKRTGYVINEGGCKFEVTDRYCLYPEGGRFGVQIPKGVWHSVEAAFPSVIIECKDGKYMAGK